MKEVYIINTSSYLPNSAIGNDEIEEYMGFIGGKASKTKKLILRNNRIKERYYAITKSGETTHTNAEMVSSAIRNLLNDDTDLIKKVDLLACGTSSPDQLMPSHAVMVHGSLPEFNSIEVVSPSGVCCSGMHALKYAYMSIKTGDKKLAITTGSERLAKTLRSENYQEELSELAKVEENPMLAFEKDFLRWMLSDGAGAFLVADKPNADNISLRMDWIEAISYANEEPVCMYMGADLDETGNLVSYKDMEKEDLSKKSVFSIKQDTKILGDRIVQLGFNKLRSICDKNGYDPSTVDHFLPHLSSFYFENKIDEVLRQNDIIIPREKWFTNLATKGNVGSGSIYLMIDELFKSGKLKKGETILLAVPESSRFSYVFCLLTVV
jgi:3-oxoacyl-[acyl-carrier-protein] synthase-3